MIVRITYSNIDHLRHCGCGANGLHLCGLDIHGAMNVGMMAVLFLAANKL